MMGCLCCVVPLAAFGLAAFPAAARARTARSQAGYACVAGLRRHSVHLRGHDRNVPGERRRPESAQRGIDPDAKRPRPAAELIAVKRGKDSIPYAMLVGSWTI